MSAKEEQQVDNLIDDVCQILSLDKDKLINKKGMKRYTEARYILVMIIRKRFDISYKWISNKFKRNSHVFAFQAELIGRDWLKADKEFIQTFKKVLSGLEQKDSKAKVFIFTNLV